jgi:rfaE bifunctional protein kinase chain/domain
MTHQLNKTWLDRTLSSIAGARVAVFGDFCLDAYWLIDPQESELSVETGLAIRRVKEQRYSLGGAGNVVANVAALGVAKLYAISLVGADVFGRQMLELLAKLKVNTDGIVLDQEDWQTLVYAKPCIAGVELNRMDFGSFGVPSGKTIEKLAGRLEQVADQVDLVILNQQVPAGVSTPAMIACINEVIARHPRCRFIVDARHRAELYRGAMLKLNAHEAARLLGEERPLNERIPLEVARQLAAALARRMERPVFVTRGERGLLAAEGKEGQEGQEVHEIPGIQIIEQTDTVGAGDTTLAALGAVLASGGDVATAARFANIAASITVRKLQTTGTATPEEIRAVGPEPDYVYLPELAEDPRHARVHDSSEIEIVRALPRALKIRHVIFDHDGTLSTLREGWERIMEPMMIRAILGPRYEEAGEALYHKVVDKVREVIEKTTGIQTLAQMQVLVELVKQFACVPPEQILDIHGYKRLYNEALLGMVNDRVAKLRRNELEPRDFQIKNAGALLQRLHQAGVKLYLASGTDVADVKTEAEAMGYAELFEGRIFGATGDVRIEAKREVLNRIIRENRLEGPELVTFGDGAVEMRLTRQRGGIAVGVASDEVRRFGLSTIKRTRLIRGGADLVIPDYSQLEQLLELLALGRSR